ncbi:MAG: flavohemoglobin expression-modulating QEGLA motif protein [Candidatus Cyclobacteriaceae bacterium M2_1C_046]
MTKVQTDINNKQLLENLPVHEELPEGIGIYLEKKLPYLIINRSAGKREKKLIKNEPSYIWSSEDADASQYIKDFSLALADEFGAFILVEFWINDDNYDTFHILYPDEKAPATVEALEEGFSSFKTEFPHLKVELDPVKRRCPDKFEELFTSQEFKKAGILKIGIEIPNFFNDPKTGKPLTVFFRKFRKKFSTTLKKAIYEFIRVQTNLGLNNYKLLGKKVLNKAVWEVDHALSEIEKQFEFLLLIAPANTDQAWKDFKNSNFTINPIFHYRLLPVDPDKLKQELYSIDIDAVDDPSMAFIFREKREELDTLITMLNERNSKEFMLSSIRMFKSVDEELLKTARNILKDIHPEKEGGRIKTADGPYFAEQAKKEIAYYRSQNIAFATEVEERDDMVGIMVSKGRLLVGKNFKMSQRRVNPLIQHEIGTHVVTYFNGERQPLKLLKTGFAGYDELQEGIAVLSEYLVDGLTANRLRILAARVTAAHDMVEGAEFKDIFNELINKHSFTKNAAYELVTRIFQSGGYTKDIIYLRGLVRLMDYLKNGGDMEILFAGKIAEKHVSIVKELMDRQILKPIPLLPRYMKDEECLNRLQKIREGIPLNELVTY